MMVMLMYSVQLFNGMTIDIYRLGSRFLWLLYLLISSVISAIVPTLTYIAYVYIVLPKSYLDILISAWLQTMNFSMPVTIIKYDYYK